MVALSVFIIATLEIVFGRKLKTVGRKKVYLAITLSKIRLDIFYPYISGGTPSFFRVSYTEIQDGVIIKTSQFEIKNSGILYHNYM